MKLVILFTFLISFNGYSSSRMYFNKFLGIVHKEMSVDSSSLTVVQCSHSVKILPMKKLIPGWTYVQVGEDKGFVEAKHLSAKRPACLQMKYPKFYQNLDLDVTEMYYWGRLYDQYFTGESRVK